MQRRTNQAIIRIVSKYQACPFVHPLTCAENSLHAELIPEERDGRVVLVCPTCNHVQESIPKPVLDSEEYIDTLTSAADKP